MRKYVHLAALAAAALMILSPIASADAATGHVLTIGKVGGTAVKSGAVLKASLVKGTSATFSLGSQKLTCKSSSFKAKVTKNPTKPGKATESLTSQTFAKCTVNAPGVTVISVIANNLPYKVSVSDAKGDPVKVSGASASMPLSFTATIMYNGGKVSCAETAASIKGHASNTGNKITFTKQKFTLATGQSPFCAIAPSAVFTGTFGPVKDSSVGGTPKVFVN